MDSGVACVKNEGMLKWVSEFSYENSSISYENCVIWQQLYRIFEMFMELCGRNRKNVQICTYIAMLYGNSMEQVSFVRLETRKCGQEPQTNRFSAILNHANGQLSATDEYTHTHTKRPTHSIYNLTLICGTSKHLHSFNAVWASELLLSPWIFMNTRNPECGSQNKSHERHIERRGEGVNLKHFSQ